jgi:hypothetical protein
VSDLFERLSGGFWRVSEVFGGVSDVDDMLGGMLVGFEGILVETEVVEIVVAVVISAEVVAGLARGMAVAWLLGRVSGLEGGDGVAGLVERLEGGLVRARILFGGDFGGVAEVSEVRRLLLLLSFGRVLKVVVREREEGRN